MSDYRAIVYLPLKPEVAKKNNLPVKLPVRVEDLPEIAQKDTIPLDVIVRGLEAQCEIKDDKRDYYLTYLVYFYYEKVKRLIAEEEYDEALQYVEKAGRLIEDYRYHFYKAIALDKTGRHGEAEIEFKLSLSSNPDFPLGHYELGVHHMKLGEMEDAKKHLEKAAEIDPKFPLPLVKLGDIELVSGDLERAMEYYKKALEIDFNLPDVHNRLGVIANQFQRFDEARSHFETALEILPGYPDAMYNLAFSYSRLGKPFKALELLRELEKRLPDDPNVLNELGLLLRELGLFEESVEKLGKAYEISKEDWMGYNYLRSVILIDLDRAQEILDELEGDYRLKAVEAIEHAKTKVEPVEGFEKELELVEMCGGDLICFLESLDSDLLKDRINRVLEFGIPMEDSEIDCVDSLEYAVAYFLRSEDFAQMEARSIEIGVALYGSGRMLGVMRVLLRLFQMKMRDGVIDVRSLIDAIIPEVQGLDWKLALRISRALDEPPKTRVEKGSDFVVSLLSDLVSPFEHADELVKRFRIVLSKGGDVI